MRRTYALSQQYEEAWDLSACDDLSIDDSVAPRDIKVAPHTAQCGKYYPYYHFYCIITTAFLDLLAHI